MIMPRMGGKEAYEKLKEINPDIKVLFCSGHGSDHKVCEELKKCGLPYSKKPFKIYDLARKVRQVLNHEDTST